MKKIISLFKRNYESDRLIYNEIVPGAEWVIAGEEATIKFDGTCCMVQDGRLYKRYDRKPTKSKNRQLKRDRSYVPQMDDFKLAPDGWIAAETLPDENTGHWPGWIPVLDGPDDQWHRESVKDQSDLSDGTFELVGPKIQGNPYRLNNHQLWSHGIEVREVYGVIPPREFDRLKDWLKEKPRSEGIVWHHPDNRMVKIKRKDFGLKWPPELTSEINGG